MMASRTFRVSLPEKLGSAFSFVAACLNEAGFVIRNPDSGLITSWSDEGEQLVTDPEKLVNEINSGSLTNVQFWSSASEDLFVSWRDEAALSVFSFYLDGVEIARSVVVATKLVESLLTTYKDGRIAGDAFTVTFE